MLLVCLSKHLTWFFHRQRGWMEFELNLVALSWFGYFCHLGFQSSLGYLCFQICQLTVRLYCQWPFGSDILAFLQGSRLESFLDLRFDVLSHRFLYLLFQQFDFDPFDLIDGILCLNLGLVLPAKVLKKLLVLFPFINVVLNDWLASQYEEFLHLSDLFSLRLVFLSEFFELFLQLKSFSFYWLVLVIDGPWNASWDLIRVLFEGEFGFVQGR